MVLDDRVGGGEEDALMTVRPPDEERRAAVRAMDLGNLAVAVLIALMAALDGQFVSDCCFHGAPSLVRGGKHLIRVTRS
jgi:hypothetical protein